MGQTERGVRGAGDSQLSVLRRRRPHRLVPVQPNTVAHQRQPQIRHHRRTSALDDSSRCRGHSRHRGLQNRRQSIDN